MENCSLSKAFCILTLGITLSGCGSKRYDAETLETPSVPAQGGEGASFQGGSALLSTEALMDVASRCRAEVNQVWQQKGRVSKERRREFHTTIGLASEKCDHLNQLVRNLKEGAQSEQSYRQNLDHAKTCAEGREGEGSAYSAEPHTSGSPHKEAFDAPAEIEAH